MHGTVAAGSRVHRFSAWQIADSASIDPQAARAQSLHSDRNDSNSGINQHAVIDDNSADRGGEWTSKKRSRESRERAATEGFSLQDDGQGTRLAWRSASSPRGKVSKVLRTQRSVESRFIGSVLEAHDRQ